METKDGINNLINFRDERGWAKHHNLESLSRALSIEASEMEKIFLWKNSDTELDIQKRDDLKLEIADALIYAYFICEKMGLDPNEIIAEKMAINRKRNWEIDE